MGNALPAISSANTPGAQTYLSLRHRLARSKQINDDGVEAGSGQARIKLRLGQASYDRVQDL